LPSEVLTRRKQGFAVPLAAWFRGDLKDLASDILLSPDHLGVLRSDSVAAMWKHHQSGLSDQSTPLWTILMYRLWQEKFLRGPFSDAAPANGLFAAN
jgi:asparagine synthase (glutamine-hydrolysing)